jgi:hypothetical protein
LPSSIPEYPIRFAVNNETPHHLGITPEKISAVIVFFIVAMGLGPVSLADQKYLWAFAIDLDGSINQNLELLTLE